MVYLAHPTNTSNTSGARYHLKITIHDTVDKWVKRSHAHLVVTYSVMAVILLSFSSPYILASPKSATDSTIVCGGGGGRGNHEGKG